MGLFVKNIYSFVAFCRCIGNVGMAIKKVFKYTVICI